MKNNYWDNSLYFKKKIMLYINEILSVYGYKVDLMMKDINLLNNKNNSVESSTAIGFCFEEFIVSKLETYTSVKYNQNPDSEFLIQRIMTGTQNSSYDCYSIFNNEKYLINIKVDKDSNNAISAINKLYKDYVLDQPELIKHFMILKFKYNVDNTGVDSMIHREIIINKIESFFLEEIDFSKGHKQDNRNWSEKFNKNSGRLQITNKFRSENKIDEYEISYKKTFEQIKAIIKNNEENNK